MRPGRQHPRVGSRRIGRLIEHRVAAWDWVDQLNSEVRTGSSAVRDRNFINVGPYEIGEELAHYIKFLTVAPVQFPRIVSEQVVKPI